MTIWTLLRAAAVVAGGSAALLAGGIAHADPAVPVPAPNIGEQLVNTATHAPQMLQTLATALGATPPAPSTPPPLAGATIRAPQQPGGAPNAASSVPGVNSLLPGTTTGTPATAPGASTGIPGLTPTAPAAPASPAQLMPTAQLDMPQVPFLPVPLPQQVSLPGDLASLAPGGLPVPHGMQAGTPAVSAPAATAPSNPLLIPLSALP
ncbi:hypothetical protein A5707_02910 [Mycobacterium kyorinense]|uniref:Uncharacterized protein n=1 Tax=Mycobacterium kyorinense TaxID=487514 RepID=A0A1A2Z2V2_9MYCO|nr:hypothetical protein [Mycobacterium kyorinense]OBI44625.1 hypothetical protein A5707_02910 [Mycobacterium kyorinense]